MISTLIAISHLSMSRRKVGEREKAKRTREDMEGEKCLILEVEKHATT